MISYLIDFLKLYTEAVLSEVNGSVFSSFFSILIFEPCCCSVLFSRPGKLPLGLLIALITMRDLTTAIISLVVLLGVATFLQRSRTGKAIRAVSDNPALASSTGIDTQKIIRVVWFAGGALAAMGGVFRGLDEQVGFEMGSGLIFLMFAGITLGGLGSAYGALIGGFFVGLLVELASLVVPAELKNAPALFILIIVLVVRPQGILGRKQRVG